MLSKLHQTILLIPDSSGTVENAEVFFQRVCNLHILKGFMESFKVKKFHQYTFVGYVRNCNTDFLAF